MGNNVKVPGIERDGADQFEAPNLTGSPERNLLMAILERAILDYVGNDSREVTSAEEWLFEEVNSPSFDEFTFPWVCQELDLDYERTARLIRQIPKRGNRRIAPWYLTKYYAARAAG